MTVLYRSDLLASNNSNMLNNLDTESEQTTKLYQALGDFETSSTNNLKGESFDAIRKKISIYKEVDVLRKLAINSIKNYVKKSND